MGAERVVVQIQFRDDEGRTEMLGAAPLGPNLFRLENLPSYAYGVSRDDVVRAAPNDDGTFVFESIVEKSGNRTLRVLLARFALESPQAVEMIGAARELGCHHESLQPHMLCLNVPEEADLAAVVEYLLGWSVWWECADPPRSFLTADE